MPAEDRFRQLVIATLAKRAANRCSNPDCGALTSGPADDPTGSVNVGEAAHIYGANPGSARYDPAMKSADRSSITNAIWLCGNCHKLIDDDPITYPADLLFVWQRNHQQWIAARVGKAGAELRRVQAETAVEEARQARKAQLSPRLILERDFLDFHLVWPHPASLNGEAVFLARRDWRDTDPVPPTFSLTNHGEGAALELEVTFDFDDPNGELSMPPIFANLGLSVDEVPTFADPPTVKILRYGRPDGSGAGLPLYQRWTTDIPNCVPGQKRSVEFPQSLLNRVFLRGLQYWVRRGERDAIKDIIMTVTISCHTIDGEPHQTQFRFRITPFWQGQHNPLIVNGHMHELPMYPKIAAKRVL